MARRGRPRKQQQLPIETELDQVWPETVVGSGTQLEPSVIRPTVTFQDGEQHVFQTLEQEGSLPVMKAVGYMPAMVGKMSWVSYTVTFQGTKVISISVDEPNLRAIAEESAKMAFMEHFADQWFEPIEATPSTAKQVEAKP